MNVLWVYAHPEQRSLNGSLKEQGLRTLAEQGHAVRVSDLYAMKWDPVVDAGDFGHDPATRLLVGEEARRAYHERSLSPDIVAEQEKLVWADAVVVQFPLWWAGPPAILKGWFDRVFVNGFAFGVKDPATGRTLRYGDGGLAGKRALLVTTIGARRATYGPRGVHGELNDVLFGMQHGIFWYTGMEVLPPFAVYSADRLGSEDFARAAEDLRQRLAALPTAEPIRFRHQDGGDYDDDLVLRPVIAPGQSGIAAHYA
ncbi:NAD(P)H-dependent oxidoreductase [Prauserella oleivorans]|uniref:NAD(P)H-dependent oxidoreductase n=1 Tax=Prauserella oleivorans TaxID=1478153 RepID=A0ABW5W7R5_9PSEU